MAETTPGRTLPPLPARLLADPLDYIVADHYRHRLLCRLCEDLATAESFDAGLGRMVADHIETDLPVHIADEEADFFPLLRRRARPEDEIEPVLDRLADDHAQDEKLGARIVRGLRKAIADAAARLPARLKRTLTSFATIERRHLALENAIVIPLARVRLSARDLQALSRSMTARHSQNGAAPS